MGIFCSFSQAYHCPLYRVNSKNIKARRTEITFNKSLEAFQEVAEALNNVSILLSEHLRADFGDENFYKSFIEKKLPEYQKIINRNIYYFPHELAFEIQSVINIAHGFEDEQEENEFDMLEKYKASIETVIVNMQAYLKSVYHIVINRAWLALVHFIKCHYAQARAGITPERMR